MLENGYSLNADIEVPDHEKITHKQRRTIFLLCEDIELHLGQPKEAMRQDFQFELEIMNGYDSISLKNCSKNSKRINRNDYCFYVSSSSSYEIKDE